jgi:hypothetical protein
MNMTLKTNAPIVRHMIEGLLTTALEAPPPSWNGAKMKARQVALDALVKASKGDLDTAGELAAVADALHAVSVRAWDAGLIWGVDYALLAGRIRDLLKAAGTSADHVTTN